MRMDYENWHPQANVWLTREDIQHIMTSYERTLGDRKQEKENARWEEIEDLV